MKWFQTFLSTKALPLLLLLPWVQNATAFLVSSPTVVSWQKQHSNKQSLFTLYDIPTLLTNLLTQQDSSNMIEHSQRIVLENGMSIIVDSLSEGNRYTQGAATLFVNMLTPASILAAAMISLGLKAPFQVPESILGDPDKIRHIESLRKAYILVTLISFCSELLAVMWGTVAVNQLTERTLEPSSSVWELLQRDFDLEWAAVNSHFVIGLIGFMYMVGLRGYVMLLAADASPALVASTLSGVGAALLLMVSIVNRGVESGGGDGIGYGSTILDLFGHYLSLLYQRACGPLHTPDVQLLGDSSSVGPLSLGAIVLEMASVLFAVYAIVSPAFNINQVGNGLDSDEKLFWSSVNERNNTKSTPANSTHVETEIKATSVPATTSSSSSSTGI
jgi:hypothetical protein